MESAGLFRRFEEARQIFGVAGSKNHLRHTSAQISDAPRYIKRADSDPMQWGLPVSPETRSL